MKAKNIYLSHSYKSPHNLLLLDECINESLADYLYKSLKEYCMKKDSLFKDFYIIQVKNNPLMEGMNDKDLADYCYDYNGVLITNDSKFFSHYLGYKILAKKGVCWNKIAQKSIKYLGINSSI